MTLQGERNRYHVEPEEIEEYWKTINETQDRIKLPPAPAMPVVRRDKAMIAKKAASTSTYTAPSYELHPHIASQQQGHRDHVATKGISSDFLSMVHKPVSMKEALKNPDGRKAMDKEWTKLEKQKESLAS